MAKLITTVCRWCGDVELPAAAARLDIPVDAGAGAVLEFTCPHCGRVDAQQVPERAVLLLLQAGVLVAVAAPGQASDTLRRPQ